MLGQLVSTVGDKNATPAVWTLRHRTTYATIFARLNYDKPDSQSWTVPKSNYTIVVTSVLENTLNDINACIRFDRLSPQQSNS